MSGAKSARVDYTRIISINYYVGVKKKNKSCKIYGIEAMRPIRTMYLCVLDRSIKSSRITGHGTQVTTLRMGHSPAILAAKIQLAKLCSSST